MKPVRLNPKTAKGQEAVEAARLYAARKNPHCHYDLTNPDERFVAIPEQQGILRRAGGFVLHMFYNPDRGIKWEHMNPGS